MHSCAEPQVWRVPSTLWQGRLAQDALTWLPWTLRPPGWQLTSGPLASSMPAAHSMDSDLAASSTCQAPAAKLRQTCKYLVHERQQAAATVTATQSQSHGR